VEPLGVHPDFQRRGLGRALLAEQFRRAARRGARQMYVECDDYPDGPAFAFYQTAGFTIYKKIAIYRKDYGQNQE
jgi:ribosomal protein S18 acetylase RimI-like enzyme